MNISDIASIDFETGSHADLRKTGAARYAEDKTTRVICLSWQLPSMFAPKQWREGEVFPQALMGWVSGGGRVSGWNVGFEFYIWNAVLIKQVHGQPIPKLKVDQLVDTMAVAAYNGLPLKLDTAAQALSHLGIAKDKVGHALMLRMSRPRNAKKDTWWHLDDPVMFDRLCAYCDTDVVVERAILADLIEPPKRELSIWRMDFRANLRGMLLDVPLVNKLMDMAHRENARMDAEMQRLTGGAVPTTRAVGQLLKYAQAIEPEITSLAKDQLAVWIEKTNHIFLSEILKLRQEAAKSSVAKLQAMLNFSNMADDRMRGLYQYYGAFRTGRDAGRGPQLQNYPRGVIKNVDAFISYIGAGGDEAGVDMFFGVNPLAAISSALRGCITVPKGKTFCSYDFAQIEARVLPWLAGDYKLLDVFIKGRDIYVEAAAGIYGVPYDQVDDAQRAVGKVSVLACGFGGGVSAFQNMASIYGLEITDEEADQTKTDWRNANPKIVQFWYDLNNAAIATVRSGRPRRAGDHIKFRMIGNNLHMELPIGRDLVYRDAIIGVGQFGNDCVTYMGVDQYTRQWIRLDAYGGKWAENATQAVARDVMKSKQLALDMIPSIAVLGPIHDEILLEMDSPELEENVSAIMNTDLAWAKGLPIGADGYVGKRFKK